MNRFAPTFAPLADIGYTFARLERPKHATDRSSSFERRLDCHRLTATPPYAGLAHPSAIVARLFVSRNDTRCPLYAPIFALAGGCL